MVSDLSLKAFLFLKFFFCLSFFSFFVLFAAVIDLLLGFLAFKIFAESVIETGNFYHGVATCGGRKFCSKFFTQLFEHFLHISRAIRLSTLIWVLMKRSFAPVKLNLNQRNHDFAGFSMHYMYLPGIFKLQSKKMFCMGTLASKLLSNP